MLMTDDFFRNRLDQLIDLRHPLAVLANRMPWQEIEAIDMFGATQITAGAGVSNAGRPRLPTRLMVSLLYLKHAFNESDEDVVQRWGRDTHLAILFWPRILLAPPALRPHSFGQVPQTAWRRRR